MDNIRYNLIEEIDWICSCTIFISSTDPSKPGDLKESFDIGAFDNQKFVSDLSLYRAGN